MTVKKVFKVDKFVEPWKRNFYLFIYYLMDPYKYKYKYKYRCITIGHKSPTRLIHPHPAP